MLRILLIRHGETDWNRDRRIMGTEDVGLNETGREQSRRSKGALAQAPVDAVFSSPILRAKQTAEILCREREVQPRFDHRLVEVNYGDWIGKKFTEVREMPGYLPYYDRLETPVAPNGETLYQVRDRAVDFFEELKKKSVDGTILVVSHADWIKCLIMHLLEIPFKNIWKFRIDNLAVSLVESDSERDRVICINQRGDYDYLFISRFAF